MAFNPLFLPFFFSGIEFDLYSTEEKPKYLGSALLPAANFTTVSGDSKEVNNTLVNTLTVSFNKELNGTSNVTFTSVVLKFSADLDAKTGYWKISGFAVDYTATVAGKKYEAKDQPIIAAPMPGFTKSPVDMNCQRGYTSCAPVGLSWTCDRQEFKSKNYGMKTVAKEGFPAAVVVTFPGLAYQPFFPESGQSGKSIE